MIQRPPMERDGAGADIVVAQRGKTDLRIWYHLGCL